MRRAFCFICVFPVLLWSSAGLLRAEDWPAYRHDNGRTAATSETIAANDLKPAWTYRSPQPRRKAWKNYKAGGQVEVKDGILRVGSRSGRTHVTFIEFRKL